MKSILFMAVFLAAQSAHAGFMDKFVAAAAKTMAKSLTETTATLNDMVITGGIEQNLHPSELGTMTQNMFSGWKTGGDLISFVFSKKGGTIFYKIDGKVTIDGKTVEYAAIANYGLVTDSKSSPRKVEIVTTSGEKASFTIAPSKNKFKIDSINGDDDDISLDLTKDVVIELKGDVPANALLKVALAVNQVGIKTLIDVCYIRSGSKLTIPAAAFRNLNFAPAGGAMFNFKKSFLAVGVESLENATEVSGVFPSVQYTSVYSDGKLVTVKKEPEFNYGLTAKGKEKPADGEITYDFFKPNAARSRPAEQLGKTGVLSSGINGTTYYDKTSMYEVPESARAEFGAWKVETQTTMEFPAQSNEAWDAVWGKLYTELVGIVQSELNTTVLPAETVSQTAVYKSIEMYSAADKNTKQDFSRAYPGTKLLTAIPTALTLRNATNEQIMKEAGVNALMSLTMKLDLAADTDRNPKFATMIPKLTFELAGQKHGIGTETKYLTGTVTGEGVKSEKIGFQTIVTTYNKYGEASKPKLTVYNTAGQLTAEELEQIVRRSDIANAFSKAIKEIKEQYKANSDYVTVWNLEN